MPRGPGSLVVSVQSPGSDGRPPGTSPSVTCWRQVEGQSQRAASETGATSLHTRSNPGLLHCRRILYHLSHKGSPRILEWVAYPFSSGSS